MRLLALTAVGLLAGIGGVVGLRLLRLARSTRELPELIVAVGLLSYTVICQPLILISGALGEPAGRPLAIALELAIALSSALTVTSLYLFSYIVFRRATPWGQALAAGGIGLALGVGLIGVVAGPTPATTVVGVLNYALAFGWGGCESLRYYAMLGRRGRLGLVDPIVRNRFLLLCGWMATTAGIDLALAACVLSGLSLARDPLPIFLCVISAGISALCAYLAFLPPSAYLRRLRPRAAEAAAGA